MNKLTICLLLVVTAFASGCARKAATGPVITGTLSYQPATTLAQDTVVTLRLTDVSVDGPALAIASVELKDVPALPYTYSLPYDAARIQAEHRYMVDARITLADQVRYATDTAYPVLTQGNTNHRDLMVIEVGSNATSAAANEVSPDISVFNGELRSAQGVTLYKAGVQQGHILWLEEDRSTGTPQPLHARYEFKGALVLRYLDSSPLEIRFDDRGRPQSVMKNQQSLPVNEQMEAINQVRNRAALLRSHALAASEAKTHRIATGG